MFSIFFALILEGRGVTQSRVAQLAPTDLSFMSTHFSHTCDTHMKHEVSGLIFALKQMLDQPNAH